MSMKKWIIGVGGTTLGAIIIGLVVIIYTLATGQQNVLKQAPTYTAPELYQKGQSLVDKRDYKQAESYLEQAISKDDKADYRSELAVAKYHLGKYDEAIGQYQLLIKKGQDPAFAWNGIGNCYRDWAEKAKGDEQARLRGEALKAYQETLKLNPQYVAAYANLAIVQVAAGDKGAAASTLDGGIAATGRDELRQTKANLGL